MNELSRLRIASAANWCAIVYLALLFAGWAGLAQFIPATDPASSAGEIAQLYQDDHTQIRIGMLLIMFAAVVFVGFAAVVARYIVRAEGGPGVLTFAFLLGAAGNMCLTFYPAIWWLIAAFRPERSPEMTQMLDDAAWLQFLGGVTIYLAMPITIGIVAFMDSSDRPAFPRWVGYANLFIAIAILPDQLLFFFHDGVFAWNGLFGIWLPVVWFVSFFLVNFYALRLRINADLAELEAESVRPLPVA